MYTIGTLVVAFLLTMINFDNIVIDAVKELFNKEISVAVYYFIALVIGLFMDLVRLIKR